LVTGAGMVGLVGIGVAGERVTGTIVTVAGSGPPGWITGGDGGPATQARLSGAWAVAVDESGSLFVADTLDCRIRKVSTSGVITTIAGTGRRGFSGDGGLATNAEIASPCGLAIDRDGSVLFTDNGNARVRKIGPDGRITTIAGDGQWGYSGDGGPATSAQLSLPGGVAVDKSGNVFFAADNRIRKVTRDGIISTVAGTGEAGSSGDGGKAEKAQLSGPWGLVIDEAGNLYVTEGTRVRRISPDGIVTTVAGTGIAGFTGDGGPATSAQLAGAMGLAVDRKGHLYIADGGTNRVRKISSDGIITTVAGDSVVGFSGDGGPATKAHFAFTFGLCADGVGNLWVADLQNRRVRKVSTDGIVHTVAGSGTSDEWTGAFSGVGGPATRARLSDPYGIAVDAEGNLLIADTDNHRIRRVNARGSIATVAGIGKSGFSGDGGPATEAQLANPWGVVSGKNGDFYVADAYNHRVRHVSKTGIITTIAGNGKDGFGGDGSPATAAQLLRPAGLALDATGNLFIADSGNNRVRKVGRDGLISTVAGTGAEGSKGDGGLATKAELYSPFGVAVDRHGDVFITEIFGNRVRKIAPDGIISTVAGHGETRFMGDGGAATDAGLFNPHGIAVDSEGTLFISEYIHHCVRKVAPNGVITTLAGSGTSGEGFSGDDGPATESRLNRPHFLALDDAGNLFVTDGGNHRIRKVLGAAAVGPK